jgi:hypothetical protein
VKEGEGVRKREREREREIHEELLFKRNDG